MNDILIFIKKLNLSFKPIVSRGFKIKILKILIYLILTYLIFKIFKILKYFIFPGYA